MRFVEDHMNLPVFHVATCLVMEQEVVDKSDGNLKVIYVTWQEKIGFMCTKMFATSLDFEIS